MVVYRLGAASIEFFLDELHDLLSQNDRVQRARAIDLTQVERADRGLRLQPFVIGDSVFCVLREGVMEWFPQLPIYQSDEEDLSHHHDETPTGTYQGLRNSESNANTK